MLHAPLTPSIGLHFAPLADFFCTEEEVFDLLASLDVSNSSGPDGFFARMLKYTATSVTPSLTRLFNQMIIQAQIATYPLDEICYS